MNTAAMLERARGSLRLVLGSRGLYAVGSRIVDFVSVVWREGIVRWSTLERLRRANDSKYTESMNFRNLQHPIALRATPEDVVTVTNTIVRREWGQFAPSAPPGWLVDAGAYIGDSTAYFLSRFRGLHAIALEPAEDTFALAARNLAPYGKRVVLLNAALWSDDAGGRLAGTSTTAALGAEGAHVETVSIQSIMRRFQIPRIDILKLDIEGAEAAVLAHDEAREWLKSVGLLILEIHGDSAMQVVRQRLDELGFQMRRFRSVWYCAPSERFVDGGIAAVAPGTGS